MEKGHTSLRRGLSWSPGRQRKYLQPGQDAHTLETEEIASWERTGFDKEHTSRKTNLTRSASVSEKEFKEARIRSQIIAAQLTIPSSSNSRGVQLFNRRKQRVNAFMLESCGEETDEAKVEVLKREPFSNKSTWAERSTEEKNTELNFRNSATKLHFSPATSEHSIGNIMEETRNDAFKEDSVRDSVIQERHFLPVKEEEEEEEEEAGDEDEKLEHNATHEIPSESSNSNLMVREHAGSKAEINWSHTGFVPAGNQLNDCHSTSGPQIVSSPTSKQSPATTNRTARPFFSPPPVCSPEVVSPVTEIPPPPSYSTPPLPAFTIPQPVTFSPPPPPSYPTPPLPAFKSLPPETCCSCPPPLSPSMSTSSAPPSQFSVSHYPPMPQYGPPTAPRPSTFVPQPTAEKKMTTSIKTGILEESAAKRTNKKSMFTFKEKPVLTPNPELLSLVQGVDEKKKPGQRSVPEPSSEEELLALGAEASNFLTKEEDMLEEARAPEWASCLKSSRTRPRTEHRPEHTLTNVSGKGAELFAKRQSRMEKYVIEKQNSAQLRSPSPTMSLPPSWVYPSNMPGRVKAIAKNSDMSAQLSQNLKAQQISKQNPRQKAAVPEPAPEPPPLENGCSKIEMDLSRHRPYQLNSSLFILNPVKDPLSTLPKGAPQARNLHPTQPLTRKTSLPNNATFFKCMSPQMPVSPAGVPEHPFGSASSHPRISSPLSAFPPERVSSPRSGAQAPRPTFSAKKAGIAPQTPKDFLTNDTASETSRITRTPSLTRHISSKEDSTTASWTSSLQRNRPSTTASCSIRSVSSPITSANSTSCQSPVINQNIKVSSPTSTLSSRPFQTPTSPSPCSPIWGSKCQSPLVGPPPTSSSTLPFRPFQTHDATSQISSSSSKRCPSPMLNRNTKSPTAISFSTSRPFQTASSPCSPLPWESRCLSPSLNQNVHPNVSPLPTSRRPQTFITSSARSPSPWGSRCQSPVANQNTQFSSMSVFTSKASQTLPTSPVSPTWSSRSLSPSVFQTTLSFPVTKPLYTSSVTSPTHTTKDSRCMSPDANGQDSKANHRLLAKNIINAAKRKNSPSPGALNNRSLPISPLGNSQPGFECQKPPISPYHSRALGVQSPTFTSPPPTPSQRTCSPARLYNTRSLTDSDASVESEDSGLRSPGLRSYNTSPRGWGGSFRVKRSTISTDL